MLWYDPQSLYWEGIQCRPRWESVPDTARSAWPFLGRLSSSSVPGWSWLPFC